MVELWSDVDLVEVRKECIKKRLSIPQTFDFIARCQNVKKL